MGDDSKRRTTMHTRRIGVAGLLLGLGLLVGGLATQSAAAFPASARAAQLAFQSGTASTQDATSTECAQGEGGADDTAETGDDEAVDGVDCVQEGEHEGENEGDC